MKASFPSHSTDFKRIELINCGCSAFRNFFRQKTIRQFYISQNVYSATFYSEIVKKQQTIRQQTKLAKSPFRYSPFGKINIWQNLIKKLFIPKSSIPK